MLFFNCRSYSSFCFSHSSQVSVTVAQALEANSAPSVSSSTGETLKYTVKVTFLGGIFLTVCVEYTDRALYSDTEN